MLSVLLQLRRLHLWSVALAATYKARITRGGGASGEDTSGAATVDAVAAVVSVVLVVIIVADAAETVRPQH